MSLTVITQKQWVTGFDVSFHIKMGSTLASHFTQPHVMEFVTTQRGARSLIYEGHKYVINRRGRDSVDKGKKIGELKSRFSQSEITLEEYVRGISAHTAI